ncbi:MAG: Spi family protease inhibitor [Prevotella sp.]|nr:Spi family protease inhibitor [Prevotella sp.]
MQKRYLFLMVTLLIVSISMLAEPITHTKAQAKASEFLFSKGQKQNVKKLAYRAPLQKNQTEKESAYYVFNVEDNQGFVIVAGNDSAPEILGYSDSGNFDKENLPVNVRDWLEEFVGLASDDKVVFDHAQELQANTPYIIAVPGDRWGKKWNLSRKEIIFKSENVTLRAGARMRTEASVYDFVGNLVGNIQVGTYSMNDSGTSFVLGDNHVGSFRAFFKPQEQPEVFGVKQLMIVSPNGTETTSIDGIEDDINSKNLPYYNLQGVCVKHPSHGVYIQGGKKVVIK